MGRFGRTEGRLDVTRGQERKHKVKFQVRQPSFVCWWVRSRFPTTTETRDAPPSSEGRRDQRGWHGDGDLNNSTRPGLLRLKEGFPGWS
jgi:hypothetical protein